jgi:long-chain acyl-CoA synthetase
MDTETGELLPPGQVGEIMVKGPNVMQGYWQGEHDQHTDVALSNEAIFVNRWMHTGDIGKMDQDGFFYIVDRAKDLIIASGFNIYPREVEEVLFKHPMVAEAAVVGMPDTYRGETIAAFIVLKPGNSSTEATQEAIKAYCRQNLTGYKIPKIIEFRDSLPKTIIGKVLKRELRTSHS